MDNHQNDRPDSSRPIFSQDMFNFEDSEENIPSSFFYNLEDQNNVSAPMIAPGSTPAVQYGSMGPSTANHNQPQSTELMTNSSNAVGLDSNLVPHSIPNFSYPQLNETQQGHSHSFQAGFYDQFSQVHNENIQRLQGMGMLYGNNTNNQMSMPYQAGSFTPNHWKATQGGDQYLKNQGYVAPPNQNFQTTQNYSSEYYDQTNKQYISPNNSQYSPNYMLLEQHNPNHNQLSAAAPSFWGSQSVPNMGSPQNQLLTTSVHQTTQGLAMLASSHSSQSQIAMQPTFSPRNVTRQEPFPTLESSNVHLNSSVQQNAYRPVIPAHVAASVAAMRSSYGNHPYLVGGVSNSVSSESRAILTYPSLHGDYNIQEYFQTSVPSGNNQHVTAPVQQQLPMSQIRPTQTTYNKEMINTRMSTLHSHSAALHGPTTSTLQSHSGALHGPATSTLYSQSAAMHGPTMTYMQPQRAILHGSRMNTLQSHSTVLHRPTITSLEPQSAILQRPAMTDLPPQGAILQSPAMSDLQSRGVMQGPAMSSNLQQRSAIFLEPSMSNMQAQNASIQGPTILPSNIPTSEDLSSIILGHSANGPIDVASSRPPSTTSDEIAQLLRKVETAGKNKQQQGAPSTPRDGFTASQCDKGKLPASPSTWPPQKQQVQAPAAPRDGVHANQRDKGKLPQSPSTGPRIIEIQRSTFLATNQTAIPAHSSPPTQQNQQRVEINQNVIDLINQGDREELPIRRGRGRPPKQPGQSSNLSNRRKGEKDQEAPKRPRGRPRKLPQQGEAEEPPKYCGRGRPPKRVQQGNDSPTVAKMLKTGESSFRSENAGASSAPQEEHMNCENMNEEDHNANQVDSNAESREKYENAIYHGSSSDWPLDPHLKKFKDDQPDAGN